MVAAKSKSNVRRAKSGPLPAALRSEQSLPGAGATTSAGPGFTAASAPWVRRVDVFGDGQVILYKGDCLEILPTLPAGSVDAVIVDPPYSERTHACHNASATGHLGAGLDDAQRRILPYQSWSPETVGVAATQFARVSSGWTACFTDHVLAPAWDSALMRAGRYVFAPLVLYAPGSRCRLGGDGPSCWCTWIIVSRTARQARWGTLPGGYLQTHNEMRAIAGGKPLKAMLAIVDDYSHKDDLVCDPCMGSGTTGVAAVQLGRKFIGIEIDEHYFKIAHKRILDAAPLFVRPKEASL